MKIIYFFVFIEVWGKKEIKQLITLRGFILICDQVFFSHTSMIKKKNLHFDG